MERHLGIPLVDHRGLGRAREQLELVVDDRLLELVGVDRADFTGRGGDLLARLDEDDAAAATTALTRAVVTAGTWSGEYSISGRDGVCRRVAVRGRSVVGQDGNSNGDGNGNGGTVTAVVGVVEGRESGPAAVGAPGRRVIGLQADGSAMYTVQGLWTQARERLDVTTVILSNRQYAILLGEYQGVGANPGRTALDMLDLGNPDLDWVRLAAGMGVEAARADTMEAFNDLFQQANARSGPFVIELMV